MDKSLLRSVLVVLRRMSQDNENIHVEAIRRRLGASRPETLRALRTLAVGGLVDGDRLRLTLTGLAVAHSLAAGQRPAGGASRPPASLGTNVVELNHFFGRKRVQSPEAQTTKGMNRCGVRRRYA